MACVTAAAALVLLLWGVADAARLRQSSGNTTGTAGNTTAAHRNNVAAHRNNVDYKLELLNHNNVQYSASISIGGQILPVIYDTGSFEVLVLSTLCTTCPGDHQLYDSSQSTSFASSDGPVRAEHVFGSGPVLSEKGYETVHLGDLNAPYGVEHMPFWQIVRHEIAVWNEDAQFSGIVGLGHPDQVPAGYGADESGDQMLLNVLGITSFSICLERGWGGPSGWLAMGPTVTALPATTGVFSAVPVVGLVHWGVRLSQVTIAGVTEQPCNPSCGAIVDSGTSLIAAPPSAMPMINALAKLIAADCSNLDSLPPLKFHIGDIEVELPPKAYVMQLQTRVPRSSPMWERVWDPQYEVHKECLPAFMMIDKVSQFGPVWILGMPFLRYYYTVFDRSAKVIHVARSTPDCHLADAPAAGVLINTTKLSNTFFSADDFAPNQVDLNKVRSPSWGASKTRNMTF